MKMHSVQFVSMTMVIQRKVMKVRSNVQSMMIQEFQLDLESEWIEVLILKMHKIRFVSMMMVTQTKVMKVICNVENTLIQEFQLDTE
jgi:hypothetical protein